MGNVGLGVSKIFVSYYVRTGIKQFMQELNFDKFGSTLHVNVHARVKNRLMQEVVDQVNEKLEEIRQRRLERTAEQDRS